MKVQNKQQSDDISSMDKPQSGYVYLFSSFPEFNRCKIGFTKNYCRRFQEIKNQAPCKTHILDCVESNNYKEDERRLHQMFKHRRKHGEWFEFDSEEQAAGLFREYFRVREIYEQKLNVLKDEIEDLKIELDQEKDQNKIIKVLKDEIDDLEIELNRKKTDGEILEEMICHLDKILDNNQITYSYDSTVHALTSMRINMGRRVGRIVGRALRDVHRSMFPK